jgi:hypothetical protein
MGLLRWGNDLRTQASGPTTSLYPSPLASGPGNRARRVPGAKSHTGARAAPEFSADAIRALVSVGGKSQMHRAARTSEASAGDLEP